MMMNGRFFILKKVYLKIELFVVLYL